VGCATQSSGVTRRILLKCQRLRRGERVPDVSQEYDGILARRGYSRDRTPLLYHRTLLPQLRGANGRPRDHSRDRQDAGVHACRQSGDRQVIGL